MKQATYTYFQIPTAREPLPSVARQILARFSDTVQTWYQRSKTRARLTELTPRLLRDVGISEDQRLREINKFFWEA